MNVTSFLDGKTSADVHIDAPIDSTVRIPLHHGRIVWRLLCAVAVILFSAYALIHQALDYEPRSIPVAIDGKHDTRDIPTDIQQIVKTTESYARDYGREWRMFITVVALLTAMFAVFREMARLQSAEPGMIVAPSGVTINSEASRRIAKRIPWSDIAAIEDRNYKGRSGVAIKLRSPDRFLDDGSFFGRLTRKSGAHIVVAPQSLQINKQDLKYLLIRYFDAYGSKRAEHSKG